MSKALLPNFGTPDRFPLIAQKSLAEVARDGRGAQRLTLADEPRAMAVLATAYERLVEACVVAKFQRAGERWTEGENPLTHIHLAHASLPPCEKEQALRLFVADEFLEAGVTPRTLMKAQAFDPAPLDLLKANLFKTVLGDFQKELHPNFLPRFP